MPMFLPDDSANAADQLADLIKGSSGSEVAAPFQVIVYSTNPLEALLMQPKSKSMLRESTEPFEGEQAVHTPTALPNRRKDSREESILIGDEQSGGNQLATSYREV